jgi:hypothetical protein
LIATRSIEGVTDHDYLPGADSSFRGNPGMCLALVRAHHKFYGTLGAANPRFIQREVFANGSVKASPEWWSHHLVASETGRQAGRPTGKNGLKNVFRHLGRGNGGDRFFENRYFA